MGGHTSTTQSIYECPCGYSFIQTDSQCYGKLRTIKRLHAKRCEIGKEHNKNVPETYSTKWVKGVRMNKDHVKDEEDFWKLGI